VLNEHLVTNLRVS